MAKKPYKFDTVIYNGERTDLNYAIMKATNGQRNRGNITTFMSVYGLSKQEAFDKCVKCYHDTIKRKERYKLICEVAEKTGKDIPTIRHRINAGLKNWDSPEDLRRYNNVRTKYFVMYKGKRMAFKKALYLATEGRSYQNPAAFKRAREYDGMTLQQCFDHFVKKIREKWGLNDKD